MVQQIKRVFAVIAIGLLVVFPAFAVTPVAIVPQAAVPLPKVKYTSEAGAEQVISPQAKLTVVHFWAIWCAPCVKELPELDAFYAQYKGKGMEVLPLAMGEKDAAKVQAFYKKLGVGVLPVALDPALTASRVVMLKGLPASIFVNAKGEIIGRAEGPVDWKAAATKEFVEKGLE